MKLYDYKMYLLSVLFVGLTVFYLCLTLRTAEKSFFLIALIWNIEVFYPLVIFFVYFCSNLTRCSSMQKEEKKVRHWKQEISPIVSPAIISGKPALHHIVVTVFLNLFSIIEFTILELFSLLLNRNIRFGISKTIYNIYIYRERK